MSPGSLPAGGDSSHRGRRRCPSPGDVSFALPRRLFVIQHIASSIRAAGDRDENTVIADIEFAFSQHEISHVIVCGNTGCGVIGNWLNISGAADVGECKPDLKRRLIPFGWSLCRNSRNSPVADARGNKLPAIQDEIGWLTGCHFQRRIVALLMITNASPTFCSTAPAMGVIVPAEAIPSIKSVSPAPMSTFL